MLGGGFSRLQANYSMSIDNIISLRLVTAEGDIITVSSSENPELFWCLKGAGHNFGIVTSAKVNAFREINGGMHWECTMIFLPNHIEEVTQAINDLDMGEGMSIHFAFTGLPPFGYVSDHYPVALGSIFPFSCLKRFRIDVSSSQRLSWNCGMPVRLQQQKQHLPLCSTSVPSTVKAHQLPTIRSTRPWTGANIKAASSLHGPSL